MFFKVFRFSNIFLLLVFIILFWIVFFCINFNEFSIKIEEKSIQQVIKEIIIFTLIFFNDLGQF